MIAPALPNGTTITRMKSGSNRAKQGVRKGVRQAREMA